MEIGREKRGSPDVEIVRLTDLTFEMTSKRRRSVNSQALRRQCPAGAVPVGLHGGLRGTKARRIESQGLYFLHVWQERPESPGYGESLLRHFLRGFRINVRIVTLEPHQFRLKFANTLIVVGTLPLRDAGTSDVKLLREGLKFENSFFDKQRDSFP
ncbi:hypothetical protein DVJ83_16600 (plasmid) [Deinococcus wulumuqiensis]|uniref:Uncharacterized protein n=1 Tax=Deinococcus wulumuqiensis TaxID=980427 RepID=A0A345IM35_9DEIO|nr:hypothetical protein DVJ83_16600 [Deinococcus wulumuqiensis]